VSEENEFIEGKIVLEAARYTTEVSAMMRGSCGE
jgi:hypothetical protein